MSAQQQHSMLTALTRAPAAEVLDSMTYSEAVLLEALRYRSPVPAVFRWARLLASALQGSEAVSCLRVPRLHPESASTAVRICMMLRRHQQACLVPVCLVQLAPCVESLTQLLGRRAAKQDMQVSNEQGSYLVPEVSPP